MNRVQIRFIKDALDQPEKLTDWENQFVNDLAEKPEGYELSEQPARVVAVNGLY